jgi:Zn-dependent protease
MSEQLFLALVACAVMLLIGFPVHEYFHAYAAYRLGDNTARYQGRLTLSPAVHFDPLGGGMLILTAVLSGGTAFFGFAKPTPVNPMNLSGGRRGQAVVAAAGPLSNLAMAAIVAIVLRVLIEGGLIPADLRSQSWVVALIEIVADFILINLSLFVFNLIPVPPLDGWGVAAEPVPGAVRGADSAGVPHRFPGRRPRDCHPAGSRDLQHPARDGLRWAAGGAAESASFGATWAAASPTPSGMTSSRG